jgi:TolA-binding protein
MHVPAFGIASVLLTLYLSAPVQGKNYILHSPKLWTPEEKEQYEREHPPLEKTKETIDTQKVPAKKELTPVKKLKMPVKKDPILVKDGVSYRQVTVKQGDTISAIARKFNKESAFYLDVLRFNDLDGSEKISSGDVIKVPLTRLKKIVPAKQAEPALTVPQKKQAVVTVPQKQLIVKSPALVPIFAGNSSAGRIPSTAPLTVPLVVPAKTEAVKQQVFTNHSASAQKQSVPPAVTPIPAIPVPEKPQPVETPAITGAHLFEQAVKAYRNGDCPTALLLFNRFLADHSSTVLAADANLFIADCYLRLSGK